MTCYEKSIVDIKNEYSNFLIYITAPLIYEGIKSIYNLALKMETQIKTIMKTNKNIKNPGIIRIFQLYLKDMPELSQANIETETQRIKIGSKCSEWYDSLLKAVIKSYIILLSYHTKEHTCNLIGGKYIDTINTQTFIHKCYIECSKLFYNRPELMIQTDNLLLANENHKYAQKLIEKAIKNSIMSMFPMNDVLIEYLKNDFIMHPNYNVDKIRENVKTEYPSSTPKEYIEHEVNDEQTKAILHQENTKTLSETVKRLLMPDNPFLAGGNIRMNNIDIVNDNLQEKNSIFSKSEEVEKMTNSVCFSNSAKSQQSKQSINQQQSKSSKNKSHQSLSLSDSDKRSLSEVNEMHKQPVNLNVNKKQDFQVTDTASTLGVGSIDKKIKNLDFEHDDVMNSFEISVEKPKLRR